MQDLRRLPHRAGRDRGPDAPAAAADRPGPSGRRAGRGAGLGDERLPARAIASASPGSSPRAGAASFCRRGEENLCDQFRATGRDANGGYAELMTVPEAFAHPIPDAFTDAEAAPLLCAGRSAIGRCD